MSLFSIDSCFRLMPDEELPKNEKWKGNYEKILLMDLKKKLGTLECFFFLPSKQIEELIIRNYRDINIETFEFAICRILLNHLKDELIQKKEEKVNFVGLVIDSLKNNETGS